MIKVNRYDYPERTIKYRNGFEKFTPASYEINYYYNDIQIAHYRSKDDVLYLRSNFIDKDRTRKEYYRALAGRYKEVYKELFDMLGIDDQSRLSEFITMM